jgi:hypothetical protein
MRKIAIFVEGQTELIFVREFLKIVYEYSGLHIECYTLFSDFKLRPEEYSYGNENEENYYQVINIGNDNAVLSRIKRRMASLTKAGFEKIIGLRDMYSSDYKQLSKTIDHGIINDFREGVEKQIAEIPNHEKIKFIFAIMEVEAWFLAMRSLIEKQHPELTIKKIKDELKFDLVNNDPEVTYFHPATILREIFQLVNMDYKKHKDELNAFFSHAEYADFEQLIIDNTKCKSFHLFFEEIL